MKLFLVAVCCFSVGCAGNLPEPSGVKFASAAPQTTPQKIAICNGIAARKRTWGSLAIGGGFIAGAGGVGTLATIEKENKAAAYSIAGATVAAGLVAAVGSYLTKDYDESFKSANCTEAYRQYYAAPNP